MATAQDGTSTEEAGGLVAIVVLVVAATDTAAVTKRSTPSKPTKAGALRLVTPSGGTKRRDRILPAKRSKKEEVGMPMAKHRASRIALLPLKPHGTVAITVLLALAKALLAEAALLRRRPSLLSRKTTTGHTPTISLSKLRRKWRLWVFWSLGRPMKGRSRTRNGRMPRN